MALAWGDTGEPQDGGEPGSCDRPTRLPLGRGSVGAGVMLQLEGVWGVGWQGHSGLGVMVLPLHTAVAYGCPGVLLGALPSQLGGCRVVWVAMEDSRRDGGKAWGDMG